MTATHCLFTSWGFSGITKCLTYHISSASTPHSESRLICYLKKIWNLSFLVGKQGQHERHRLETACASQGPVNNANWPPLGGRPAYVHLFLHKTTLCRPIRTAHQYKGSDVTCLRLGTTAFRAQQLLSAGALGCRRRYPGRESGRRLGTAKANKKVLRKYVHL